jgi:hypothetical protein
MPLFQMFWSEARFNEGRASKLKYILRNLLYCMHGAKSGDLVALLAFELFSKRTEVGKGMVS